METSIISKQGTADTSTASVLQIFENPTIQVDSAQTYYCPDSEFYKIRGGYIAEVIQNPFVKFMRQSITDKVTRDLTKVTMAAFEKPMDEVEKYAPEKVIMKNAILVDWLTVVRKGNIIVAYTSNSFLKENYLYANASMVNPQHQLDGGLGIIPSMDIWRRIFAANPGMKKELNIIVRTRNQEVVSTMSHVLDNLMVSGQTGLDIKTQKLFKNISEELHSEYDFETGILRKVYPTGLPEGKEYRKFGATFSKLGPQDAFLVTGKVNLEKTQRLLRRGIQDLNSITTELIYESKLVA